MALKIKCHVLVKQLPISVKLLLLFFHLKKHHIFLLDMISFTLAFLVKGKFCTLSRLMKLNFRILYLFLLPSVPVFTVFPLFATREIRKVPVQRGYSDHYCSSVWLGAGLKL